MMSNFEYRQDKMGWLACIPVDDKWLMGCIWARVMQCTLHPHHLWKNGKQNARSRDAGKKKGTIPCPRHCARCREQIETPAPRSCRRLLISESDQIQWSVAAEKGFVAQKLSSSCAETK
jgi:hypothetical protein